MARQILKHLGIETLAVNLYLTINSCLLELFLSFWILFPHGISFALISNPGCQRIKITKSWSYLFYSFKDQLIGIEFFLSVDRLIRMRFFILLFHWFLNLESHACSLLIPNFYRLVLLLSSSWKCITSQVLPAVTNDFLFRVLYLSFLLFLTGDLYLNRESISYIHFLGHRFKVQFTPDFYLSFSFSVLLSLTVESIHDLVSIFLLGSVFPFDNRFLDMKETEVQTCWK